MSQLFRKPEADRISCQRKVRIGWSWLGPGRLGRHAAGSACTPAQARTYGVPVYPLHRKIPVQVAERCGPAGGPARGNRSAVPRPGTHRHHVPRSFQQSPRSRRIRPARRIRYPGVSVSKLGVFPACRRFRMWFTAVPRQGDPAAYARDRFSGRRYVYGSGCDSTRKPKHMRTAVSPEGDRRTTGTLTRRRIAANQAIAGCYVFRWRDTPRTQVIPGTPTGAALILH